MKQSEPCPTCRAPVIIASTGAAVEVCPDGLLRRHACGQQPRTGMTLTAPALRALVADLLAMPSPAESF